MDNCSVKTDKEISEQSSHISINSSTLETNQKESQNTSTRSSVAKIVAAIEAKTAEFNQINSRNNNKMVFKPSNAIQAKQPTTGSSISNISANTSSVVSSTASTVTTATVTATNTSTSVTSISTTTSIGQSDNVMSSSSVISKEIVDTNLNKKVEKQEKQTDEMKKEEVDREEGEEEEEEQQNVPPFPIASNITPTPIIYRTHRSNSACVANTTIPAQFASRIARRNTQVLQPMSIVVESAVPFQRPSSRSLARTEKTSTNNISCDHTSTLFNNSIASSSVSSSSSTSSSSNSSSSSSSTSSATNVIPSLDSIGRLQSTDSVESGTPPSTPITKHVTLDELILEPKKSREQDEIVKSIMATARLRKEEFARLLEEHAQIVNEINRVETSLL